MPADLMSDHEAEALPKRANLGCGWDKRDGFLNIDMHEMHAPDMIGDVVNLPQLPSGHFDYLVAQDVLEHLERSKVPVALAEWSRLLAPNGVLNVRVPSMLHLLRLLAMPAYRPADKAAEIMHLMFGTQAYTGDFHLAGFTATLLVKLLGDAGLLVCEATVHHEWLFDIKARKAEMLINPKERVHQAYFELLDRPADPGGLDRFATALGNGSMTSDALHNALITSSEAQFLRSRPSYLMAHNGEDIRF